MPPCAETGRWCAIGGASVGTLRKTGLVRGLNRGATGGTGETGAASRRCPGAPESWSRKNGGYPWVLGAEIVWMPESSMGIREAEEGGSSTAGGEVPCCRTKG